MSKRDFGTIKSLLHFDYPYYAEPNDGLGDEVSSETWTREGNTKLAGTEIPYEVSGSPKFGYRCAYFPDTSSYITGTNTSEIFNLSPDGEYEFEAFGKFSGTGGNMLKIGDLELVADNTGVLSLSSQSWDISCNSGENTLTEQAWEHILLRLSGGNAEVYLDGSKVIETTITGNTNITPSSVVLGGFVGYMDEFVFRHSAGSGVPSIPSRPYNGTLDVNSVGGFGNGSDGDITISTAGIIINSYSMISAVSNERVFTASSWSGSSASMPPVGSEIMIHITAPKSTATASYPYVGLYAFGRVAGIDGGDITLEEGISIENGYDFTLSSELLSDYYVQAITVPNYESLAVTDEGQTGGQIYAMPWNTSGGGGIVAFRCRSDCTINGSIFVHGWGATRYDLQQMTHSKLIDRFLCGSGGGIFITCGGTFTAPETARLGASWDGSGKGGAGITSGNGGNGGAGYGGGGAGDIEDGGTGGSGGVGGGGGGGNSGKGGDAGRSTTHATGGTGGAGFAHSSYASATTGGGIQGITPGGSSGTRDYINASGGGGAGGDGAGTHWGDPPGLAGASIVLVASRLVAEASAVSTGGAGGHQEQGTASGGGGTGFCYISCGEQVSVNA